MAATKKAPVKKAAAKKVTAPVIKKSAKKAPTVSPKVEKKIDIHEGIGYEVVVGDEKVDDVNKGEERAQHDAPYVEVITDPMDDIHDWIHPGVQAIPTPEEEKELKAEGEAYREAKRLAEEAAKKADEEKVEV